MKFWEVAAMTAALALAFSMEQADVGVLQSMYGPIGRSLQVSAVALGTLTTWRGVVQVLNAPPGVKIPLLVPLQQRMTDGAVAHRLLQHHSWGLLAIRSTGYTYLLPERSSGASQALELALLETFHR